MRLFVSQGSALARRRLLLLLCPNGEWRSRSVQFYVSEASPPEFRNPAYVLRYLTSGLMVALTSAQPHLYPRHRWTGCDLAADDLGVLEACHRLLSTTFARFAASYMKGARAAQALACVRGLAEYDPTAQESLSDVGEGGGDDAGEGTKDPGDGTSAATKGGPMRCLATHPRPTKTTKIGQRSMLGTAPSVLPFVAAALLAVWCCYVWRWSL